jgi:Zn-dependent M16 (insulinase) family peptidase
LNEGAMGDASQYFSRKMQQFLYPDSPYSHNSGGDPEDVIKMKYEELKNFHKTYYHPSNSKIYTYGNFPLEKHLEFTDKVISRFERQKHENPFKALKKPEKNEYFLIKGPPEQSFFFLFFNKKL